MKVKQILILMLFLVNMSIFAQEKTVSGTVSDESGGLPQVSILIKGTTKGTETDFDGRYSIKAKTGDVLVFSYLGMKTVERTVGSSKMINVKMVEGGEVLDEIIVVGYGATTKQSFTGTAKVVKTAELEKKSVSNISQALSGEIAGVNVINTSGQPGTTATIRIRGFGSVNGNRAPLYVVDGVPFNGSINSINPSDVASATVLKDATATAIYGSRGANGVILITTKKGKSGSSIIEVDVKTGVNVNLLPRYDRIKSPEKYIELAWEAMKNTGDALGQNPVDYANANLFSGSGINPSYNLWNVTNTSDLIDPATGKVRAGVTRKYDPENWEDYGFQSSIRNEVNLKMSGGNDNTTYFSSFGMLDDIGYIINSDYKRVSTRLNITHKPKKWLTANVNIGYSYGKQTTNGQSSDSGSIFWFVDNMPSIYPLFTRDINGALIPDEIYGGYEYDYGIGRGFGALTNSIGDATYDLNQNKRHSLNGNFSFNIKISDALTLENKYGAQYYSYISNNINNPFYGSGASNGGSLFKQNREALTQNFLTLLRFNKSYGDHTLTAIIAHEANQFKRERTYISKNKVVNLFTGLDNPNNYVVSSSDPSGYTEETALESYFGQVSYNYKGKYFTSTTLRRDGTSRFYKNKWGTFGSAGFSWVTSKEDFMEDVSFINYLKLKVSYGILGDQGVGFYSGQNGYNISVLDGDIALELRAIQNTDITWEKSKMFQTGIEFTAFNNRIDASIDYYIKNTTDLLFNRRLNPSSGDALITVNDGELQNKGLEFDITTHIVNNNDFKLDFVINGEFLNTTLTKMPIDPATGEQKTLDVSGSFGRSAGHSLFDFYLRDWAGVDPADGSAMWYMNYYDANSNGTYDSGEEIKSLTEYMAANPTNEISETLTKSYQNATQRYVGKSIVPDVRGAFRLSGSYNNFDFSTQFAYSLGGYAYDGAYAGLMGNDQSGGNNYSTDILNSWKNPGDITSVPRLYSNRETNVNSSSTRFLTSTDFLALNNVKVGYTLPSKFLGKTGVTGLNIWLSGDNLFLLSARNGFNPATSEVGSSNTYRYSPLSTFTLGVRVKF